MNEISRRGLIQASLGVGIGLPTLSALAAQPAMADSLIPNPGFEDVESGLPTSWQPFNDASVSRVSSATTPVHSGARSVRLADPDTSTGVGLRSAFVPIDPGTTYRALVYSYDQAGKSQIYLEFWDANERRLSVVTDENHTLDVWQELRAWGTAPSNAAFATVLIYLPVGNVGTSFFDDASLAADSGAPQLDDLGPASEVTSTSVAHPIGNHIWTATSGVSPVQVGAFNVTTHKIDRLIPLPSGDGTWAMASIGTDLYVGTYTPGDLYRIDTTAGTVTKVANFGQFIWCLAATPDGRIVAGTYPDAGAFEYDPATGETTEYGTAVSGEQYVRCIAASDTTIYAGVGAHAHLIAVDRATGGKQEVLPSTYFNRTFVATMTLAGTRLVVSLSPTATMLIFDLADTGAPVEVQAPAGEQYITAITVDESDSSIYFGCRPSGTLYRYDSSTGELTALGAPYDGAYFNRIFLADGLIRAELTSEVVEFDPASGNFTGYGLVEAGLPPAPELAMQMAATRNIVLVSGKAGIQVHNLTSGTSTRTFLTGEAKTMTPVGNSVYLGVYTLARLFKMRSDGSQLAQFGSVGHEQTRPSDALYDEPANRLLMTTEPEYGLLIGALVVYDIDADRIEVHRGVVPDQSISSLAKLGHVAYLGSHIRNLGVEPRVDTATVSAFDLSTKAVSWQVTPVAGAARITSLMAYRGRIYGTTNNGKLFEMNPTSGEVTAAVSIATGMSTLVLARERLYGTDGKRVFNVTTSANQPPQVRTVVSGLAAQTYSFPMIVASHDGSTLYTMKAKNLVRLSFR